LQRKELVAPVLKVVVSRGYGRYDSLDLRSQSRQTWIAIKESAGVPVLLLGPLTNGAIRALIEPFVWIGYGSSVIRVGHRLDRSLGQSRHVVGRGGRLSEGDTQNWNYKKGHDCSRKPVHEYSPLFEGKEKRIRSLAMPLLLLSLLTKAF